MNAHRKIRFRREPLRAVDLLEARLKIKDDAWYAARLERLGRVIFGDLWDPGAPKAASENTEPS